MLPLRRLLYRALCICCCCCCFVASVTVAPSATLTSMRCLLYFTYCLFTAGRCNSICAPQCFVTIRCRCQRCCRQVISTPTSKRRLSQPTSIHQHCCPPHPAWPRFPLYFDCACTICRCCGGAPASSPA